MRHPSVQSSPVQLDRIQVWSENKKMVELNSANRNFVTWFVTCFVTYFEKCFVTCFVNWAKTFLVILVPLVVVSVAPAASNSAAAAQTFPIQSVQKIKFKFSSAQIKISGNLSTQLEMTGADTEELKVSTEDGVLVIEPRDSKSIKKINLNVTSGSVPVEFFLGQGQVVVQDWKGPILVNLQKGEFESVRSQGDFKLHMLKGKALVSQHTGDLALDFYNVDLNIKNAEGAVQISNFSGDTGLQKTKGDVKWNSLSGPLKVEQSQGSLQIETQKGSIVASDFQGRIEGLNSEGSTQVAAVESTEMNFRSLSGGIRVTSSPKASQWVNLSTVSGELWAPSYLHETRDGAGKNVQGRLRGVEPKGVLRLRSADGSISLK